MNKTITTSNLQAKTLKLKKYSDKIKLLNSLAKNDASLRNLILAKARSNSVTAPTYPLPHVPFLGQEESGNPTEGQFASLNLNASAFPPLRLERGNVKGKFAAAAAPNGIQKSRGRLPLVRISKRLHMHIKSILPTDKFNLDVANNKTIVYYFNNNFKKFKITSILENSFLSMNRLISEPVLNIKPNKVIIHLFFYSSTSPSILSNASHVAPHKEGNLGLANLLKSKSLQLQALCEFLSKKFKKPVEFELIRLHHPSLESNILANTIGYIAKNTRKTFRVIMLKLYKSTKIKKFNEFKYIYNIKKFKPTALVGFRIKLGGRLLGQRIVPRFTSRTIQRGNLGKTKADFITTSRFTNKNKRGAFSFTVTMGHKFF